MSSKDPEVIKKSRNRETRKAVRSGKKTMPRSQEAKIESSDSGLNASPVDHPSSSLESSADASENWLPLVPSGVMVLPGNARPVLLLKHESSGETLPVWMGSLDASVALQELGQGGQGSPHTITKMILANFGITKGRCFFVERIGHHQFVNLHLETESGTELPGSPYRVRADEAMSLSLAIKVLFFSTKEFIAQCRVLNQELEKLQESLLTGTVGEVFPDLEIDFKKTGYLM
jgi:hypothetical protein